MRAAPAPRRTRRAERIRRHRLPPRLPLHLRAGGRAAGAPENRRRQGSAGERLHRRRHLRQGRALRRARAPSGPALAAAPAHRREGRGRIPPDRLGRRAGPDRRGLRPRHREAWSRGGLALLLCRHHGPGAARRDQSAAPCHGLFAAGRDHLLAPLQRRLEGRRRRVLRKRPPRDGEVRPDRRLGLQSGLDPGQRDDPYRQGAEDAGRGAGRGRSLRDADREGRRPSCRAPARHRRRARLRHHARALRRGLRRPRLSRALHRSPGRARGPSREPGPRLGGRHHRDSRPTRSPRSRA